MAQPPQGPNAGQTGARRSADGATTRSSAAQAAGRVGRHVGHGRRDLLGRQRARHVQRRAGDARRGRRRRRRGRRRRARQPVAGRMAVRRRADGGGQLRQRDVVAVGGRAVAVVELFVLAGDAQLAQAAHEDARAQVQVVLVARAGVEEDAASSARSASACVAATRRDPRPSSAARPPSRSRRSRGRRAARCRAGGRPRASRRPQGQHHHGGERVAATSFRAPRSGARNASTPPCRRSVRPRSAGRGAATARRPCRPRGWRPPRRGRGGASPAPARRTRPTTCRRRRAPRASAMVRSRWSSAGMTSR